MKEILLTSSALILALLALRQLFRRTVSRRMQYALWLLVLVRLLVPVNVGTLAHNVLSAAEPVQAVVEERLDTPVLYVQDGTERRPAQLANGNAPQGDPLSPPSDAAQSAPADRIGDVVNAVRLDVVEFFDCRLQREGHIRPRIAVRDRENVQRVHRFPVLFEQCRTRDDHVAQQQPVNGFMLYQR